mmetsp:Transcript_45183/g.86411  ORF Transcript_45183/g.86411 Transcript_45183/m.86411 type:complete len:226 (+) Transcript_45183:1264-1941(+)
MTREKPQRNTKGITGYSTTAGALATTSAATCRTATVILRRRYMRTEAVAINSQSTNITAPHTASARFASSSTSLLRADRYTDSLSSSWPSLWFTAPIPSCHVAFESWGGSGTWSMPATPNTPAFRKSRTASARLMRLASRSVPHTSGPANTLISPIHIKPSTNGAIAPQATTTYFVVWKSAKYRSITEACRASRSSTAWPAPASSVKGGGMCTKSNPLLRASALN